MTNTVPEAAFFSRTHIDTLQVLLKLTERCNLNCSYCYYFNMGDQSYKARPAAISINVIEQLVTFLNQACNAYVIGKINIIFHGGEPMLLKVSRFRQTCQLLKTALDGKVDFDFSMQTNGTLFSPQWCDVLSKYGVEVGISMDGPQAIQDKERVDHKGKGSHQTVMDNLIFLDSYKEKDNFKNKGVMSVLNAAYDYRQICHHFIHELGFKELNFLLPDCNYDDGIPDSRTALEYGQILCDIFDVWTQYQHITIREVEGVLAKFQQSQLSESAKHAVKARTDKGIHYIANQIIVIHSDGQLSIDDSLIPAYEWRKNEESLYLAKNSLIDFISQPLLKDISHAYQKVPEPCKKCTWYNLCQSGDIGNRFSRAKGFDNPSIFCDGLKVFYQHVTSYLYQNGYPEEQIRKLLLVDEVS